MSFSIRDISGYASERLNAPRGNFYYRNRDLTKRYGVPLFQMLPDIVEHD